MSNYSITVIIPNYNKEQFLEKCIHSVLEQTYENINIIVIDDCSTDNSLTILNKLENKIPNLKVYKNKKNSGVSFSRNHGAKRAVTDYITFLDADDFYYNNSKIENEMNLIKKYKKNNKDIISYSKIIRISYDGKDIKKLKNIKYQNGNIFKELVIGKNFKGIMRDYCLKKDIFFEVGMYDENCNYFEDLDLLIRISKKYEYYCTNEIGTAYRDSINGLSKKSRLESYKARRKIYRKNVADFKFLIKLKYIIQMEVTFGIYFLKLYLSILKNKIKKRVLK